LEIPQLILDIQEAEEVLNQRSRLAHDRAEKASQLKKFVSEQALEMFKTRDKIKAEIENFIQQDEVYC